MLFRQFFTVSFCVNKNQNRLQKQLESRWPNTLTHAHTDAPNRHRQTQSGSMCLCAIQTKWKASQQQCIHRIETTIRDTFTMDSAHYRCFHIHTRTCCSMGDNGIPYMCVSVLVCRLQTNSADEYVSKTNFDTLLILLFVCARIGCRYTCVKKEKKIVTDYKQSACATTKWKINFPMRKRACDWMIFDAITSETNGSCMFYDFIDVIVTEIRRTNSLHSSRFLFFFSLPSSSSRFLFITWLGDVSFCFSHTQYT